MKPPFRTLIIMVMGLSFTACQTTPASKPLTELSDAEKRAIYVNGPVKTPEKDHSRFRKALVITGAVLIIVPIAFLINSAAQAAREGKQVQVGK